MCGDSCAENEAVAQAIQRVRAIGEYRERFAETFGQPAGQSATPEHLAQAIAAFERSLITPRTAFDRFVEGDELALNAEAQRGLRVFQDAGCIQ